MSMDRVTLADILKVQAVCEKGSSKPTAIHMTLPDATALVDDLRSSRPGGEPIEQVTVCGMRLVVDERCPPGHFYLMDA